MIRLITGLPGSGKTYYAVYEITKLFFNFDEEFFRYTKKDDNLVIFTNIDEFKLPSISFEYFLKKNSLTLEQFFSVDFQNKLLKKYSHIVYFLDEAQKYFPKKFNDNDVLFFFQYHRHLGIDIYLLTQDSKLLCPSIVSLVEYEIRATRQTKHLFNTFTYFFISNSEKIATKRLKKDPRIFSLYSSFSVLSSVNAHPKPIRKYVVYVVLLSLISFFIFLFFLHNFSSSSIPSYSHSHSFDYSNNSISSLTVSSSPVKDNCSSSTHSVNSSLNDAATATQPAPVSSRRSSSKFLSRSSHFKSFIHKPDLSYTPKPRKKYVVVKCGGVWDDAHKLLFINLQGHLVPVQEFPFTYVQRSCCQPVLVWLPEKYFKNSIYASSYYKDRASSSLPASSSLSYNK